jgi:hypothetical protein
MYKYSEAIAVCTVVMSVFLLLSGTGVVAGLTHGWVTGEPHWGISQFVLWTFACAGLAGISAYAVFFWGWLTDR